MSFKPAIASLSLGRSPIHTIPKKFTSAAQAGLSGIEIYFEDLHHLSTTYPGGSTPANLLRAAHSIRALCTTLSLTIIAIGPFSSYEGSLSPLHRARKRAELSLWFQLARILDTDVIQIPSAILPAGEDITGDFDTVVKDLRELADMGAKESPRVRFAYESLCFGTYSDTWSAAWEIVRAVDRENFGLCLDTFNIAGREWADPSAPSGKLPNADEILAESLQRMVREIDVAKVFYVQVVDAERLDAPLDEKHPFWVEGQKARMSWSRNCRLFACEEERGGYLPIVQVLKAICDEAGQGLGYKGWISMELFNRSLWAEGEEVPREHAERAMKSWRRLVRAMGWEGKLEEERVEDLKAVNDDSANGVGFSARL